MAASQDNSGPSDQNVPQWKRELILRRRALSRTLPAGSSSVQLTCPSVVAAVRQADSVGLPLPVTAAGENVSGNPQRCISSTIESLVSSNKGSLDQTQADFHPGGRFSSSSTTSVGLVENMRLVEHDSAPGSRKPLINGVGLDSKSLIDPVKYRSIMGEEKSVKKSCASNRKMDNNSAVKAIGLVLGENNNCSHPHNEECLSDSSEELQYGPGIVKKLKSKYMSMTLRENKNKGVRPSLSNMRRATSLENMLDNDENETGKPPLIKPQHKFTKRTEASNMTIKSQYSTQHQQRYRSVSRGNDSIKRARSVEALLRYDIKPQTTAAQLPSPIEKKVLLKSLSKDEIIIVEKSTAVKTEEKPPIPQSTSRKKRPTMNAQQKAGLPPSDVVKQTLKIFENSQSKTVASTPKTNGAAMAKLNINLANQNKPGPGSNKPLLSPKPSPEKIRRSPLAGKILSPKRAPSPTPSVDPQRSDSVPVPIVEVQRKVPLLASAIEVQRKVPLPPATIEIQEKSPVSVVDNNTQRSPTIPSRLGLLPLDVKPVSLAIASSLSSPKLKMPSPVTTSPVKTVLTPTNGVAKPSPTTPPFVKPRTPSPIPKLPSTTVSQEKNISPIESTASPVINARTPSPVSRVRTPSPIAKLRTASPTLKPAPITNGKLKETVLEVGAFSEDEDATDGCEDKNISRSTMENIRKGGSSVQFSFCNNVPATDKTKSYLPDDKSRSAPVVSKVIPKTSSLPFLEKTAPLPSSRHPTPMSPLPGLKSPDTPTVQTKQVGIIRPIVNSKIQSPSLTDREIEKNLINRVKSCPVEQPTKVVASLKSSEIVVGNVSESLKNIVGADDHINKGMKEVKSLRDTVNSNGTGLWDHKKKPWNQQQNTMVFNFSDRKDPVPDYIENDGIIMRVKREKIRPGDSGFILLDPSLEESSTDCENDDYCGGPPSPCNVHFEGDNILINGKSNLRKQPKQRKLRITFDDKAVQLFEYPSESSLLNDSSSSIPSTSAIGGLPIPPPPSGPTPGLPVPSGLKRKRPPVPPKPRMAPKPPVLPKPKFLKQSWPVGGSSLASYTSKVSMGTEDFQLGVTRTTPLPKPKEATETSSAAATSDTDNVAWSTDTADDLLF